MSAIRFAARYHNTIPLIQKRTVVDARRIASTTIKEPDRFAGYTRDEQIGSPLVRIKHEDGSIGQPQNLKQVLRSIDRSTHTIVQIAKGGEQDGVLAQIYSTIDLLKKVREKEARTKQLERASREQKPKQVELNWAIDPNDLGLKLKQIEQFLNKGKKVEILLAAKKRQRRASQEEGENVLNKIREKVLELGAKEVRPMEGQVLKQALLVLKKG